jgi:hypothetical protein
MGFAVLPAIGPFVALLALISSRIELRRSDRWWWIAALLVALPYGMRGFVTEGALDLLQVLAVWLIYRSAALLRQSQGAGTAAFDVGAGLVAGLAVALVVGLQQVIDVRSETALTLLDGVVWQAHPALFAHSMLVLSALLGIVVPSARLRATALGLGAVAAVLAGSREALFAWLLVAIGLRLFSRRGDHVTRAVEWSTIVVVLVIASGVGGLLGLGRPGFLVDVAGNVRSPNLFRGTEAADGDWWHPLQARFTAQPLRVAGETRTAFTVTKTGFDPWARLQQVVTLWPGETYTLSAALFATDGQRPGLDGWGAAGRANPPSILMTTVDRGRLGGSASGAIELLETAYEPLGGGWSRATVRFRYGGEAPLVWYSGVVVDRVAGVGAQVTFAELQLTAGASDALTAAYVPGDVGRGVMDLRTSRFPIWRDALTAIEARPSLGWGPGGLPGAVHAELPDDVRVRPVAAHAHNLVLTTWVERGLLGALGVLLLLGLLSLRAVQQRDRPALVVILGVIVLNVFDASLMSGGVIYPLAAMLGWRAIGAPRGDQPRRAWAAPGVRSRSPVRRGRGRAAVSLGAALGLGERSTRSPRLVARAHLRHAAVAGVRVVERPVPGVRARGARRAGAGPCARPRPRPSRSASSRRAARRRRSAPAPSCWCGALAVVLAPLARCPDEAGAARGAVWGRPVVILGTGERAGAGGALPGRPPRGRPAPGRRLRRTGGRVGDVPRTAGIDDAWAFLDARTRSGT